MSKLPFRHDSRRAAALTVFLTVGCSGAGNDPSTIELDPAVPVSVHTAGPGLRCDEGTYGSGANASSDSEFYDDERMNAQLKASPELRKLTGLSHVSSCDEARHFQAALNAGEPPGGQVDAARADDGLVEKIYNGALTRRWGSVAIFVFRAGLTTRFCSGTIITRFSILTAARCVQDVLGTAHDGQVNVSIDYDSPDGAHSTYQLARGETLEASTSPDYTGTGDSRHDMAILSRISGSWPIPYVPQPDGVSGKDYVSLDATYPIFTDDKFAVNAYGENTNGADTDIDRARSTVDHSTLQVDYVSTNDDYFLVNAPSTARMCNGDQGSMALRYSGVSVGYAGPILMGVLSTYDKPSDVHCVSTGAKERWTGVASQLYWLFNKIRGKGAGCIHFDDPVTIASWYACY